MIKGRFPTMLVRDENYSWERDFPIQLQSSMPEGQSIFKLELELSATEIRSFREYIGSNLNSTLLIEIALGNKSPSFKILKRGPGAKVLSEKIQKIAEYLSKMIDCVYIPAVRTARKAEIIIEGILSDELAVIEDDPKFKAALSEVANLQKPILDQISKNITMSLKEFMPNINKAVVDISQEGRHQALRRAYEVTIDDGTPTKLQEKGDGVQSLAALCLMRHASERTARGKNIILAIEEPESHLHPNAIYQIKQVISDISNHSQVILTTHCPAFINRLVMQSNVIVLENRAKQAANIKEIRDVLGVRASDNLRNAELVVVVEGESDRVALKAILIKSSAKISSAIGQGHIAIETLLGGSNLSYKISQIRDALCGYYCYLDNDKCGQDAFRVAKEHGLVTEKDVTFSICDGMREAELEDVYNAAIYTEMIRDKYEVGLDRSSFRNNNKWSNRMRDTFLSQGKQWNEKFEEILKGEIAEIIAQNPEQALNPHKRSSIDALVAALENRCCKEQIMA